jgi:hypothetical protein
MATDASVATNNISHMLGRCADIDIVPAIKTVNVSWRVSLVRASLDTGYVSREIKQFAARWKWGMWVVLRACPDEDVVHMTGMFK